MTSGRPVLAGVLLALVAPGAAAATPGWQSREVIPQAPRQLTLLPGGAALLVAGATSGGGNAPNRLAVRPVGGPLGAAADLPGANATRTIPISHDAAGNALIAHDTRVAYRSASGAFAPAVQSLAAANPVAALSMAPTGEALLALGGGTAPTPLKLAFRPAGAEATIDQAGAQLLPASDPMPATTTRIVGVQLDPDGAAIAVYISGADLLQTTRAAGSASFGAPVKIPSPLPNGYMNQVKMSSDPSGWSLLTWGGYSTPPETGSVDRAVAAVRPPGGTFETPAVLPGAALSLGGPSGAINAAGHAVLSWTERTSGPKQQACTPGTNNLRGSDRVARVAVRTGGSWSVGSMGPGSWPEISGGGAVSAAGSSIVLLTGEQSEGPSQCDVTDDRGKFIAHRGVSTGGGFSWVETTTIQDSVPSGNANGSSFSPSSTGLDVEPGGNALITFSLGPAEYLRAFEDPTGPSDGGVPPGGGTPGGGTPGSGGTPGGDTPGAGGPGVGTTMPGGTALPGGTPPGGGSATPIKPIVAKALVSVPSSIDPGKPAVTAVCPPAAADECLYSFVVRTAFGATTRARAAAAKPGPVIAKASVTVKPGKRRSVALKLNAAGRKLVKRRRAVRIRVATTVRVGARTFKTEKATTLKAAKRPGPRARSTGKAPSGLLPAGLHRR